MATKRTSKPVSEADADAAAEVIEAVEMIEPAEAVKPVKPLRPAKNAAKPAPRKYEKDEMIRCRSITFGRLICSSFKNRGLIYEWSNYGDECSIEYQDLLALKSSKSNFVYAPLFVIDDDNLVAEWKLDNLYEEFVGFDAPEEFFEVSVSELRAKLTAAPKGLKETIKSAAAKCIADGTLDSIGKVRVIDEILGTELLEFMK